MQTFLFFERYSHNLVYSPVGTHFFTQMLLPSLVLIKGASSIRMIVPMHLEQPQGVYGLQVVMSCIGRVMDQWDRLESNQFEIRKPRLASSEKNQITRITLIHTNTRSTNKQTDAPWKSSAPKIKHMTHTDGKTTMPTMELQSTNPSTVQSCRKHVATNRPTCQLDRLLRHAWSQDNMTNPNRTRIIIRSQSPNKTKHPPNLKKQQIWNTALNTAGNEKHTACSQH